MSCFVYKVMGLTFHDRISTQLIYRFELAQVVARRITKTMFFFRFEFHWLVFFIFFIFGGRGGGGGLIYYSLHVLFFSFHLFIIIIFYLLSL